MERKKKLTKLLKDSIDIKFNEKIQLYFIRKKTRLVKSKRMEKEALR